MNPAESLRCADAARADAALAEASSVLCVPSQNGGVCVRLHPHRASFSALATVNFTGVNGPPLCEPSQNGCFLD